VLLAGAGRAGLRLRPFEAAEAALAICSLGLEQALERYREPPAQRLARTGCDQLFRVGWRRLADDDRAPHAALAQLVRTVSRSIAPKDRSRK
jgi:hypothetical protein